MKQKNLNPANEMNVNNESELEKIADRMVYIFTKPAMMIVLMSAIVLTMVVNAFKIIEAIKLNENVHLNVLALVFAVIEFAILLFLIGDKNSKNKQKIDL